MQTTTTVRTLQNFRALCARIAKNFATLEQTPIANMPRIVNEIDGLYAAWLDWTTGMHGNVVGNGNGRRKAKATETTNGNASGTLPGAKPKRRRRRRKAAYAGTGVAA